MEKTVVANWLGTARVGYWVGVFLSPANQQKLADLLSELQQELPGVLWSTPTTQLHTTLFEVVMTFRDYDEDRDELFEKHRAALDAELTTQLAKQGPITIHFDTLEVSPNAVIIRGTDDGSFQRVRDAIYGKHLLPEGTRRPPDIVHSTITRYLKEVDVDRVQKIVAKHHLEFTEVVDHFELIRVWRMPMDYTTLKTYPLSGG